MAVGYNPRIITDKLVFCVDVANTKSYPGSGTSLYDLSGNNYDGTMSDVTITSDGHMSFNGQIRVLRLPFQKVIYPKILVYILERVLENLLMSVGLISKEQITTQVTQG